MSSKPPKAKECRCWLDYPNPNHKGKCEYYECVKARTGNYAGNGTKTVCKLKEQKNEEKTISPN